ncbi:MAG: RpiB/LacA/LacB family sugar-phosphate isomerase [Desulfobacterales bacterium]
MAGIAVGADHAGFLFKGTVVESLQKHGWTVLDLGTHDQRPVDYPDIVSRICAAVLYEKFGSLAMALRLAAQDLKAFYFEAVISRPGARVPGSREFSDWYWN